MHSVHAATYDPETGHVLATVHAAPHMIERMKNAIAIPAGLDVDSDPAAWVVDLAAGDLVHRGRPAEADEINAERDRRIAAGFGFLGHVLQCRPEDKQRIAGAATLAGFAIAAGVLPGDFTWHGRPDPFAWIDAANVAMTLDAHQAFAMGQAAVAHESAHIFAARALKEQAGGVLDFRNDAYWPEVAA